MAATDPSRVASRDASAWDAVDGAEQSEATACAIDNDLTVQCDGKIGSDPDDVLRIEFPNFSTIANGDTVTVEVLAVHNIGSFALLPYKADDTVVTTNKITVTGGTGSIVFTLTTAFIGDVEDQGSGTWACRLTEDLGISGDYKYAEVDGDLTVSAAGVTGRLIGMLHQRKFPRVP